MLRLISGWVVMVTFALLLANGQSARGGESLDLVSSQTDVLRVEPILVTVRLESDQIRFLPPGPGKSDAGELRFEIEPAVKPRKGAKPLPLEAQASAMDAQTRDYDLLEWYQFPGEGKFTVRAVMEHKGVKLTSKPFTFTILSPADGDVELPSVARIHHPPWCNYGTNKFCGDTFDLVNRWPDSRLAKYCHYWNGRFLQHNKEYEKAIESYQTVVKQGPKFALADDAEFGIVECLTALGKTDEAQKHNAAMLKKYDRKASQTAVLRLAQGRKPKVHPDDQRAYVALKLARGYMSLDEDGRVKTVVFDSPLVTDADLVHLKSLTKLQRLLIYRAQVTDAGMVHLKGLTDLRYLKLWPAGITDIGLQHLQGLVNLEELKVGRTRVTEKGLNELRKTLPKLKDVME